MKGRLRWARGSTCRRLLPSSAPLLTLFLFLFLFLWFQQPCYAQVDPVDPCPDSASVDSDTLLCECHPRALCGPTCTNGRFSPFTCPTCACNHAPEILSVDSPVAGTYLVGSAVPITFTVASVIAVDIYLYQQKSTSAAVGTSGPEYQILSLLAANVSTPAPVLPTAASHSHQHTFYWDTTTSLEYRERAMRADGLVIAVLPHDTLFSFKTSQPFSLLSQHASSTCPRGFHLRDPEPTPAFNATATSTTTPSTTATVSSSSAMDGQALNLTRCAPCPKGSFSTDGLACQSCSGDMTTLTPAQTSPDSCDVSIASAIALFTYHPLLTIERNAPSITVAADTTTITECVRLCVLDTLCGAFEFTHTCVQTKMGLCTRYFDTLTTILPQQVLVEREDTRRRPNASSLEEDFRPHLFTKDSVPAPLAAFTSKGLASTNAAVLQTYMSTSLHACASLCLRTGDTCLSFASGIGSRAGSCTLYTQNSASLGVDVNTRLSAQFGDLAIYERDALPPCPPGSTFTAAGMAVTNSSAGQCVPCPQHSYAASQTQCTACPSDRPFTATNGSATVASCLPALCHSSAQGPNENSECTCDIGDTCVGSLCSIDGKARHFYVAGECFDCECLAGPEGPSVDHVLTPTSGAVLYWDDRYNIEYVANSAVRFVDIFLGIQHPSLPNTLLLTRYIAYRTRNTGVYRWKVPQLFPRTDYVIVIIHRPDAGEEMAPTHRHTGFFSIVQRPAMCPSGSINADTGAPPCVACPVGSYSASEFSCTPCPHGTTTYDTGSADISSCVVSASSGLGLFTTYPRAYLTTDSLGGYYLETIDHVTIHQCAQLCLDDAGCKGFNAGVNDTVQEGDCFLVYANLNFTSRSELRPIEQLSFYNLDEAPAVLTADTFTHHRTCHLDASEYRRVDASPEACAQVCLHDSCCLGFHYTSGGSCGFLHSSPYTHAAMDDDDLLALVSKWPGGEDSGGTSPGSVSAMPPTLVCDGGLGKELFEKNIVLSFLTHVPRSLVTNDAARSVLVQAIRTSVMYATNLASDTYLLQVDLTEHQADGGDAQPSATGVTLAATIRFATMDARDAAETAVSDMSVQIVWPPQFGDVFTASFGAAMGRCLPGTVSQTGDRSFPCRSCRMGTFANPSQTKCVLCPDDFSSMPRSTDVSDCFNPFANATSMSSSTPTSGNSVPATAVADSALLYFDEGDVWEGSFIYYAASGDIDHSGSVTVEVERRILDDTGAYTKARCLITIFHGLPCDPLLGCRTAGKTEYFANILHIDGNVDPHTLRIEHLTGFNGWGGITDRSYNRRFMTGVVAIKAGRLTFQGTYGNMGSFTMHKLCAASQDALLFTVGAHFTGTFTCEEAAASPGGDSVRRIDVYIEDVTSTAIQAVVDFDHQFGGVSQLRTHGFLPSARCRSLRLIPFFAEAWLTPRVPGVPSFVLDATIAEDGRSLLGHFDKVPACTCLDTVPPEIQAECGRFGAGEDFCFVSDACPEAERSPYVGWSYVNERIAGGQACDDVKLRHVCSDHIGQCPKGWSFYNNRCYSSGTSQLEGSVGFAEAAALCSNASASLISVHGAQDERQLAALFIASLNLSDATVMDRLRSSNGTVWLGLQRLMNGASGLQTIAWDDGRPATYTNWRKTHPREGYACAALSIVLASTPSPETVMIRNHAFVLDWVSLPCDSDPVPSSPAHAPSAVSMCMKAVVAADFSCACTAQCLPDALVQEGGLCETNEHCPLAFAISGTSRFVRACNESEIVPVPTPDQSCHDINPLFFTTPQGTCARCRVAAECGVNEVLLGDCTATTSPECASCGLFCDQCGSASGVPKCTHCSGGLFLSARTNQCVSECEDGFFPDPLNPGMCAPCEATCATCVGPTANNCTSCALDGGRYFIAQANACSTSCPQAMFQHHLTRTCRPCSSCDAGTQYRARSCQQASDTVCLNLTRCDGFEAEVRAPTPTSDRVCESSICHAGKEVVNGSCVACAAGYFDDDGRSATPCIPCPSGFVSDVGAIGACTPCPRGTRWSNATVPPSCQSCVTGLTFQAIEAQSQCDRVANCSAGSYLITAATASSDIICRPCPPRTFSLDGDTVCTPWTECAAGYEPASEPSASTDRLCARCVAGSTYKPTPGSYSCINVTQSCVLSEEIAAPTASSDRTCRGCSSNEYLNTFHQRCVPLKQCGLGVEYEDVRATHTSNRMCANLTACDPSSEFIFVHATPTTDRVCRPLSVCGQNEFEEIAPVFGPANFTGGVFASSRGIDLSSMLVSDRRCTQCSVCPGVTVSPCTEASNAVCSGCGDDCVSGLTFESSACTASAPRVCTNCTVCNFQSHYQASPCTQQRDATCEPISLCAAGVEYLATPATTTSDAVCEPISLCDIGYGQVVGPTETSDRVCSVCEEDTFSSAVGSGPCLRARECGPGTLEVLPPTPIADRVCGSCPHGEFRANASSPIKHCTPFTVCQPGEYVDVEGTPSSDRVCRPCTHATFSTTQNFVALPDAMGMLGYCNPHTPCVAGTFVSVPGSLMQDQTCTQCPPRTFTNETDLAECTPFQTCPAGTFAHSGTATGDQVCEACPEGTFSLSTNQRHCLPHSQCEADEYVLAQGSSTSDRVCAACVAGFFKNAATQECVAWTECGVGEREARAPSSVFDRDCEPCPRGTYQPTAGQIGCLNASPPCAEGFFEYAPSTASTDRVCEACDPLIGAFQDTPDSPFCQQVSSCAPGSFISQNATSSSDVVCTPCDAGYFSDRADMLACAACDGVALYQDQSGRAACKAVSDCPKGHVEIDGPSPSSDRQCGLCDGVLTFFSEQASECVQVSSCTSLELLVREATPFTDTVCECNSNVAYRRDLTEDELADRDPTSSEVFVCMPITDCSVVGAANAKGFVVRPATSSTDNVCGVEPVLYSLFVLNGLDFDLLASADGVFFLTIDTQLNDILLAAGADQAGDVTMFAKGIRRGSTIVDVAFTSASQNATKLLAARSAFEGLVASGHVSLAPLTPTMSFVAQFTATHHPCTNGTVSATGSTPFCQQCPESFAPSSTRTECIDCRSNPSRNECAAVEIPPAATSSSTRVFGSVGIAVLIVCIIMTALIVGAAVFYFSRGKAKVHVIEVPMNTHAYKNPVYAGNELGSVVEGDADNENDDGDDGEDADVADGNEQRQHAWGVAVVSNSSTTGQHHAHDVDGYQPVLPPLERSLGEGQYHPLHGHSLTRGATHAGDDSDGQYHAFEDEAQHPSKRRVAARPTSSSRRKSSNEGVTNPLMVQKQTGLYAEPNDAERRHHPSENDAPRSDAVRHYPAPPVSPSIAAPSSLPTQPSSSNNNSEFTNQETVTVLPGTLDESSSEALPPSRNQYFRLNDSFSSANAIDIHQVDVRNIHTPAVRERFTEEDDSVLFQHGKATHDEKHEQRMRMRMPVRLPALGVVEESGGELVHGRHADNDVADSDDDERIRSRESNRRTAETRGLHFPRPPLRAASPAWDSAESDSDTSVSGEKPDKSSA